VSSVLTADAIMKIVKIVILLKSVLIALWKCVVVGSIIYLENYNKPKVTNFIRIEEVEYTTINNDT
jgi:hypothetical protein